MSLFRSLRQRIRKTKINCMPWKRYKYEIQKLPISSQCLFSKNGISYDVLEIELREESWLFPDEELMEVLQVQSNLKRKHLSEIESEEVPYDEDWTTSDYIYYYEEKENDQKQQT